MKTWEIFGTWQHNKTKQKYLIELDVVCKDDQDPLDVFYKVYDMDGMTYCGGSVDPLCQEFKPLVIIKSVQPHIFLIHKA